MCNKRKLVDAMELQATQAENHILQKWVRGLRSAAALGEKGKDSRFSSDKTLTCFRSHLFLRLKGMQCAKHLHFNNPECSLQIFARDGFPRSGDVIAELFTLNENET